MSGGMVTVELLMMSLGVAVAGAFGVLARRHFAGARRWHAWAMITCAVAAGATAGVWGGCLLAGVPPFFWSSAVLSHPSTLGTSVGAQPA
jgi:hypothetical protein